MYPHHVACILRLQMLPKVFLHIGSQQVCIANRSVGGLTGSRVAGAMGRVLVEDVIKRRHSHWQASGFKLEDGTALTLSAYVDNLYSCSNSIDGAVMILEDAANELSSSWNQNIKPISRMVLACSDCPDASPDSANWPMLEEFPCLGHTLEGNAGIRACFTNTKRSMWKAFWGNCGHRVMRQAPVSMKCKLLDRACRSILSYRCSRWPPQPRIAQELDRVQSKMVAAIQRIPRASEETAAEYVTRRNKTAARKCKELGQ